MTDFEKTDFSPLENKLSEVFFGKKFKILPPPLFGSARPIIEHDNLINEIGIFSIALNSVNIGFFAFAISDIGDIYGTIELFFNQKDGIGSNSIEIIRFWKQSDNWSFKMAGQ